MKVNKNLADIYRKDVIKESKFIQQYIAWFDSYRVNPLLSYFTPQDIANIHKLAISPTMNCNVKEKYRLLGEIMTNRGFKLIGGGTNRRAYECIYDDRVVAKVATDQVGFTSNLREAVNQNVLKPFCSKTFEVSPCGSLALIEKVVPIKSVSEFQKYSSEIYDILYFKIRNNDIAMEDIGTRSMKNWGYRSGFGPVLLDYPTMYVADPNKRLCKNRLNGRICCGTLDYDEGFNCIVCSECGRTYFAKTIAKSDGDDIKSLLSAVGYHKKEGVNHMRIEIVKSSTGEVISSRECGGKSNHVDSTISNMITNNGFSENRSINKKKRPRVSFVPLNETSDLPVFPPEITEEHIEENQPHISLNEKVEDVYNIFIDTFNKHNSGINFDSLNVSENHHVAVTELAKAVNQMTIKSNPFISEEEAFELYRKVSFATMKGEGTLDLNNVRTTNDTMLNEMLRELTHSIPNTDMFPVFYKILLNVKNTHTFFKSILSFWMTLLELDSFESNGDIYCVYTYIYDIYRRNVSKALNDYRYNIVLSGNFTYNTNNILSFVNLGATEIQNYIDSDEIDIYKYVSISFNPNCATIFFIDCTHNNEKLEEDTDDSETSPVNDNIHLIPDEVTKPISRKQQQRYGGGKNKKNKKRKNHK